LIERAPSLFLKGRALGADQYDKLTRGLLGIVAFAAIVIWWTSCN
jgi:hypothetical protein